MENLRNLLKISPTKLEEVNQVFADPNSRFLNDFLDVVSKYGTPEEINHKHSESRRFINLLKKVSNRSIDNTNDLRWLIDQRDKGAFVTVQEYRDSILANDQRSINMANAVTLEVSAIQYFSWLREICEEAIVQRSLIPGRFISVRKMKESEQDGDLPAIIAAMDIIGASFVETLDTKGTDGSNNHLNGPETITGYFGGIGQPNEYALKWLDEYLYYYTNYGVQQVLNFNSGTILLGFMLHKIGINIQFKISVFYGSDNPYHAFWIMMMAKLYQREDGSTPLVGFNWSNSINNETMAIASLFRNQLGLEKEVRFEHHITETYKHIVRQPYNRRMELMNIVDRVPNIAAKHEGGDPEIDSARDHPSDILDYFRDRSEVETSGEMAALLQNFKDKVAATNHTARVLTANHQGFIAARNLHK
ncbi:MAG TPA: hypothetical protein VN226_07295 [Anaerolineales bacterium]|nr:hypothetical protein [Anaerolineales bacterium]